MNIFLDIDGTVFNKKTGSPANGLKGFLEYILANHDVYWLSSHCRGELEHLYAHLDRYIEDKDVVALTRRIKPTNWDVLKSDAIDFTQPFVWFDDYLLEAEKNVLRRHGTIGRWVKTDLTNNANSLCDALPVL